MITLPPVLSDYTLEIEFLLDALGPTDTELSIDTRVGELVDDEDDLLALYRLSGLETHANEPLLCLAMRLRSSRQKAA